MEKHSSASLKNEVVAALKESKGIKVVALNIKKLTDIADYMVIVTANSTVHVKTLSEKVRERLAPLGLKPIGTEGGETREWMLVDFGIIIVHIMLENVRNFYELEKLWGLNKITRK